MLKDFLWHKNCQISNLFVITTILALISILLLPSKLTVLTDESKGTTKTLTIDSGTKIMMFIGYVIAAVGINSLIIHSCNHNETPLAITLYIIAPLFMALSIFIMLWLSGKSGQWVKKN